MTDASIAAPAPPRPHRLRTGRPRTGHVAGRTANWDAYPVLLIGGMLMIFPFIWQIIMSLSTQAEVTSVPPTLLPSEPQFQNYAEVFEVLPFVNQFSVSVGVTVIRVLGQIVLATMAGYAFARMTFRGNKILFALFLSILMVPTQIYVIPQYEIVRSLGLLNTIAGIAAPGVFSAFSTFLMRQHYLGMPKELEEAARLDGCNPWQIYWRIMLPLSGPAIGSVTILTTMASWNDLLWPLVVATYDKKMPLSVGLATLSGQYTTDYPLMMAASLMAMLPIIILFVLLQKRVVNGLAHSGMKG